MQGSSLKSSLWEFSFSMAKYNIETVLTLAKQLGKIKSLKQAILIWRGVTSN